MDIVYSTLLVTSAAYVLCTNHDTNMKNSIHNKQQEQTQREEEEKEEEGIGVGEGGEG